MKSVVIEIPVVEALMLVVITVIAGVHSISMAWISVPIVVILLLEVVQFRSSVSEEHLRVKVQLDQLVRLSLMDIRDLRCTYFVPTWRGNLQQTCDYIPDGGGSGRRFSYSKGIIGKAFKEKGPRVENFADDNEYRTRMISEYGYSQDELRKVSPDRRSYYCHPIVDERLKVLGLVYFDSSNPNTFLMSTGNVTEAIDRSCRVIQDSLL